MSEEENSKDKVKLSMKERARLARKAAYQNQKAKMKERVAILRATPEYKKKKEEMRLARKDAYRAQKLRMKEKDTKKKEGLRKSSEQTSLTDRQNRVKELFSTLSIAADLGDKSLESNQAKNSPTDASSSSNPKKPLLRLIRSPD